MAVMIKPRKKGSLKLISFPRLYSSDVHMSKSKEGSRYWGLFAHFFMQPLGQKGLTMRKYGFPLHPWNGKDRSLYWQKSAHLDGHISWNFMTHPYIPPFLCWASVQISFNVRGPQGITSYDLLTNYIPINNNERSLNIFCVYALKMFFTPGNSD